MDTTMDKESSTEFSETILQVTKEKVAEWCSILNRMGVEDETQDKWNSIFTKQVYDLYDEMIDEAKHRQNVLLTDIENLLQKSETLCKELRIKMPVYGSEKLNLYQEKALLIKRVEEYTNLIEERKTEIEALNETQSQLCKALGRKRRSIPTSPLPTTEYISDFKQYLETLESEKFEREEKFLKLKTAIVDLAEELKFEPILDFQRTVLSPDDSLFLVTDMNMEKLEQFHEFLEEQRLTLKEEILSLREKIKQLWEMLSEDIQSSDAFLQRHTGTTYETLSALREEVKRCEDLKKANIEVFIKHFRKELVDLWDKCHLTQEQRDFEYFHSSLYTEDLLSLHDLEIQKMKTFYNTNSNLFSLIEKRQELWTKMLDLEERATAPDRYKNRGGQLLKEEKERNALSKKIPKIEEQLIELANDFEKRTGEQFLSWGQTVETIIASSHKQRENLKKLKLSARKQKDKTVTPCKSTLGLASSASMQNLAHLTPNVLKSKRKICTPLMSSKRLKVLGEIDENVPRTAPPKLTINGSSIGRSKYSLERAKRIKKCRRISQRMALKRLNDENVSQEYDEFKENLTVKQDCRSTVFMDSSALAVPLPATPVRPTNNANTPLRTPGNSNLKLRTPHTASKLSTAPSLKLLF